MARSAKLYGTVQLKSDRYSVIKPMRVITPFGCGLVWRVLYWVYRAATAANFINKNNA